MIVPIKRESTAVLIKTANESATEHFMQLKTVKHSAAVNLVFYSALH